MQVVAAMLFAAKEGVEAGVQQSGEQPRPLREDGIIAEEGDAHGLFAAQRHAVGGDRQPFAALHALLQFEHDGGVEFAHLNHADVVGARFLQGAVVGGRVLVVDEDV